VSRIFGHGTRGDQCWVCTPSLSNAEPLQLSASRNATQCLPSHPEASQVCGGPSTAKQSWESMSSEARPRQSGLLDACASFVWHLAFQLSGQCSLAAVMPCTGRTHSVCKSLLKAEAERVACACALRRCVRST